MLRLLSILPVEVDNELARLLVLAGVNGLDLILPAAARRLPRVGLGAGRRRAVGGVFPVLLCALGAAGRRGAR